MSLPGFSRGHFAGGLGDCQVSTAGNLRAGYPDLKKRQKSRLDQQLCRAALSSIRFGYLFSPTRVIGWNIGAHANPLHRKKRGGRKGGPDFNNPDKALILLYVLNQMVPEEDS